MKITKIITFGREPGSRSYEAIWALPPDGDGYVQYILERFCEGYSTGYGEDGGVLPSYRYTLLDPDYNPEVKPELLAFIKSLGD